MREYPTTSPPKFCTVCGAIINKSSVIEERTVYDSMTAAARTSKAKVKLVCSTGKAGHPTYILVNENTSSPYWYGP